MRTLWHGEWIETPRPNPVPGAAEIRVEATAPLAPFGAAHGREFGNPLRKVASFTVTDGPAATLRKARSKRAEGTYTGDYHLVLVLGESDGRRVIALAPRAPRCAGWMLAPAALVRDAPAGEELFRAAAARLLARAAELAPLARQSYLYSGMEPPAELAAALDEALAASAAGPPAASQKILRPPADAAGEAAQILPMPVTGPHRYARRSSSSAPATTFGSRSCPPSTAHRCAARSSSTASRRSPRWPPATSASPPPRPTPPRRSTRSPTAGSSSSPPTTTPTPRSRPARSTRATASSSRSRRS